MIMGCASLPGAEYGTSRWRPTLLVEQRVWQAGLLNPEPPVYGLGEPRGCIRLGELRVEIDSLSFAPATHHLTMRVYVGEAGSANRTVAQLVTRAPNGEAVSKIIVPQPGVVLSVDPRETPVLSVEHIGYRTLSLDLRRLSRRAERRGSTPSVNLGAT
jgi:hypothetical protein